MQWCDAHLQTTSSSRFSRMIAPGSSRGWYSSRRTTPRRGSPGHGRQFGDKSHKYFSTCSRRNWGGRSSSTGCRRTFPARARPKSECAGGRSPSDRREGAADLKAMGRARRPGRERGAGSERRTRGVRCRGHRGAMISYRASSIARGASSRGSKRASPPPRSVPVPRWTRPIPSSSSIESRTYSRARTCPTPSGAALPSPGGSRTDRASRTRRTC